MFQPLSVDALKLAFMEGSFVENAWDLVGPGAAVAMDELRIYNSVVPEPAVLSMHSLALAVLVIAQALRRGRRSRDLFD